MNLERFLNLEFEDFVFQAEMLADEKAEEVRNSMVASAFTAWLMNPGKMDFEEYLRGLGLVDKDESIPQDEKQRMIAESLAVAERIKRADKSQ